LDIQQGRRHFGERPFVTRIQYGQHSLQPVHLRYLDAVLRGEE
jgi:hypothetical protein